MQPSIHSISTSSLDKINYRQKGKNSDGRLIKGFIRDASSKISVGSIPSKFETIVYNNNNNKAFGSSQLRFSQQDSDLPGPGYYEAPTNTTILFGEKESISKKGYGNGFVSTAERNTFQTRYLNSGPGPGTYSTDVSLMSKASQSTTSLKGQSMFLSKQRNTKTMENINKVIVETPGPGEYNPELQKRENTYKSSFISRSNREKYLNSNQNPAPGEYNIKRQIVQKKPYPHKGYLSSFCNPVEKHQKADYMKELIHFLENGKKKLLVGTSQPIPEIETQLPAPTTYDPKIPSFKPEYPFQQATSNFKEGVKDRFGDLKDRSKEKKPFPGPQEYRVEDYGFTKVGQEEALVSGSAFMSESARKPYGDYDRKMGPSRSVPYILPKKKSFHLNLGRKFI
ncbi:sperm-tail PG-rich repeat protein (macronuclear) [Tetrahymena thermophila SB210]|uniref:Sperm-tail PG-rich repeat protein n=1 Tax=Tetrahymena thermophila (strain SB210) TaxID=312017 RepID=Q23DW3_TETTS|nr:sperm-tail PG-rich repeat protein [Tetrahymena thermophila SB210]EAR94531.1 sperm-tail PG-rich repeat protein [Tetrahymena thermophila SB210]|eukprot:XP_001014573.1 sperm-tail PG-rich repeat protein [Tetrahymena thermophila SB210]